jgi:hypothetical protein
MKDATEMTMQNSDASGVRATSITDCPESTRDAAQVTVLTSQIPKILTKEIRLEKEGGLIKLPSAQLVQGSAEVKHIQCMRDFSALLQLLEDTQALVYGVPKENLSQAKVVTKKAFESLDNTNGVITRSNQHFDWPDGAGIMMFDYDPDGEALTKDAVLQLLYDACPEIKDVDHLWWMSSSSNIRNEETGEQLSGVTGQRVYIMVEDASDIPRAAEIIAQKLWLAGKGFFKISKSGVMLERVPFDMAVYQPSRLDFAAGASTTAPLVQERGQPVLVEGARNLLDTRAVLRDLGAEDLSHVDAFKLAKGTAAKHDADKVKRQYVSKMSEKLKVNNNRLRDDDMPDLIGGVIETKSLPPYWPLHVWTGDELVEMTVEAALNNRFGYHESLCMDPIEPDYDGGRLVGKLYLDQKHPILNSFARGGQPFKLLDNVPEIFLPGRLSDAVDESVNVIERKGAAYSYGGSLAEPIAGKLVNLDVIRTKILLSRLIDFEGAKGPCDPSSDLAKGVIYHGGDRCINPVKGFVDHPIIDADFRLFPKQGYDREMQILGRFDHNRFDIEDRVLTDDEIMHHLTRIYAPFTGFDLAGSEDRSVLMAAIFSAVVRQVLPTCPAFGFDAPMQGSGKTLLAETIAIISSGEKASAIAPGRTDYDEEFRKRLMSLFLKGEKAYLFDNIVGQFDSASLAAALTNEVYEDRILQYSKTAKIYVKALFLFTGNNLRFTGDMSRRVLTARLKPADDNLTQRAYQFDPMVKGQQMRREIISSVLTLINHWKQCGAPRASGAMTSFSEWDTLVRQPLAFLAKQYPDFGLLDVLDVSSTQQADSGDKEALIALLVTLAAYRGVAVRFKAGELFESLRSNLDLQDVIFAFVRRESVQSSQHVGNLLRGFVDRNVEGLVLRAKKVSGSMSYWIELTSDTHLKTIEQLPLKQSVLLTHDDSGVRQVMPQLIQAP